ncbi:MAG: preprotein translocase subunit SecE [Lachnospiraceae bacterium]
MGEITANTVTKEKAPKKSWFKGLKSEFKKIVWPDKESLVKESAAVIVITVILGLVIALIDMAVEYGVNLII